MVSSAQTEEVLKVIVANPAMIDAYKAGVPGNGKPFPDGSKIVKLQWKPKKSTEAPFVVDVPDTFTQAFVIEKDSKRFPKSGGWGYALFNYEATSDTFTADRGHQRLRTRMPCGREGEGLHLPPVPEAVNGVSATSAPEYAARRPTGSSTAHRRTALDAALQEPRPIGASVVRARGSGQLYLALPSSS